jgi:hypothetical protein
MVGVKDGTMGSEMSITEDSLIMAEAGRDGTIGIENAIIAHEETVQENEALIL